MRSYTFYMYKDDGGLIGSSTMTLESDDAAQAHVREIFRSYPACEELEVWETPRYVTQGRRTRADLLDAAKPHHRRRAGERLRHVR